MGEIPLAPLYKGGFLNPPQFFAIPELRTRLFAIAIHILSEEGHFLRTMTHDFLYLSDDLILRTTDLTTTSMRHDAEGTVVITSRLDDHIRTCGILLELPHLEIFVPLRVVSYFFMSDQ